MAERIRILVTSDIHGVIFPFDELTGAMHDAGLARIHTLISYLRNDRTLLVDNGDSFVGTPLTSYHMRRHPDDIMPVTTVMREMKYDYINLGNHDFSCGPEALMMHVQNVGAPCITGNLMFHGKPFGPTYAVRKIGEYKIVFFGVTSANTALTEPSRNLRRFQFKDAVSSAEKAVTAIRRMENPDLVIGMYHGGFEKDPLTGESFKADPKENEANRILAIPGIDVLITGHQHLSLTGKLLDTTYVQTAADGKEIAMIDIDPKTKECEARLLKSDVDADEDLIAFAQKEYEESQTWLDEELAHTADDLTAAVPAESRMDPSGFVSVMNKIQMDTTGAQLSAYAFNDSCRGLPEVIKRRDLFRLGMPFGAFVVKKITGAVLREYLEKCAEFWTIKDTHISQASRFETPKPLHGRYDMVSGVDYTIKVTNDIGKRIVSLTYKGEPVEDDQEFTICLARYRAAGNGNYPMLRDLPVVGSYARDLLTMCEDWLKEHPVVSRVEDPTIITLTK
ncbi:MAG: bifunctional metallophosphatase/5'-nucleotidase [Solobacterium sp.]|nr:bifunctional metallophosphatase/5'-nucleotidase [Solobacterium sp.]